MVDGSINIPSNGEGEEVNSNSSSQTENTANTQEEQVLPWTIQYLKDNGYNLEKDTLDITKHPKEVYKVIADLTQRLEQDITPLVTITEANWERSVPSLAKIIREKLERPNFKDTGLDFVLKNVVLKMLPGEKGAIFKAKMNNESLNEILTTLERVVDKQGHPLYIGRETFELYGAKHRLDEKTVNKILKFLRLIESLKTEEKRAIFLLQTTCADDAGLPTEWDKESSLSKYLQKTELRELNVHRQRDVRLVNNINSRNFSKGAIRKPGNNNRTRKSPDIIIQEAATFFKSTMNLGDITKEMKDIMSQRHKKKICLGCGKAKHYYKKCPNVNLRH